MMKVAVLYGGPSLERGTRAHPGVNVACGQITPCLPMLTTLGTDALVRDLMTTIEASKNEINLTT
jgi:hypothetical protein